MFSVAHPWRMMSGWLVIVAVIGGLSVGFSGVYNDNFRVPGSDSQRALDLLSERFPAFSGADARVVVHAAGGNAGKSTVDPVELNDGIARLEKLEGVAAVASPQLNEARNTALINVQYDVPVTDFKGTEGLDALREAAKPIGDAGYGVEYGGQIPENIIIPSGMAEAVGIGAALIILLIAFGSILAVGAPLIVAGVGIVTGLSGVALLAALTDVSTFVPTLAVMVGLGIGIDYALFLVTRFRQELRAGKSVPDATALANATAGQSVVFAGVTVLVSLCGLAFAGLPVFTTMGFGTGIVVAITMIAAVTLLPAILGLLGTRLLPKKVRRQLAEPDGQTRPLPGGEPSWVQRLAGRVERRPLVWALGALAVLAVFTAPLFDMRTWPSDAGVEPTSNTVRRSYDVIERNFGPGYNGPLLVAVDLKQLDRTQLAQLGADLTHVKGVESVAPPQLASDGTAAVLTVIPEYPSQDERTPGLVQRVRHVAPAGASVTGLTAIYSDVSDVLAKNLWKVIAVVVGASLLLLMLMFRSVVIPIKAAVMNLLSIGAAYGVVTAVFQWGWGAELLGLPHAVPVTSFLPVLMFALLFGLSMDYEVFLLSRVREHWIKTGDSKGAVIVGLSSTARVITSAALIMVAVFVGFSLDPSVVVKMVGVGMATAIAVDATIVRLVLVPALMTMLGDRNWWLPGWLDRVLPHLDHKGPPGRSA